MTLCYTVTIFVIFSADFTVAIFDVKKGLGNYNGKAH